MLIPITLPRTFSFKECLWFLDRGLDDLMHKVIIDHIYKACQFGNQIIYLNISANDSELLIQCNSNQIEVQKVIQYVERWFDLRRDLKPFYTLLSDDEDFAPLATNYRSLHLIGIPDLFEALCWCIIGQQINLNFAYRIKRRLVELYGQSVEGAPCELYLFPTPEKLSEVSLEQLKALQLTTRKAEYLKGLAEAFISGIITEKEFLKLDEEQAKERLLLQRGIGPWTAHYATMKALGGMDCWPIGDSGINRALLQLKRLDAKTKHAATRAVFEKFKGWQSYLCYYLWRTQREPSDQA